MLDIFLKTNHFQLLTKALDAASFKNEVIADNIANVNTPGFKRNEVFFEEKLKQVMDEPTLNDKLKVTSSRHMQVNQSSVDTGDPVAEVVKMRDSSYRNDGNNVDIDVEMAKMAKNKIYYDSMEQSLSNEIRLLRMAITGRS